MSPARLDVERYYQPPTDARKAAVMALLDEKKSGWEITFIKRQAHPKDMHSGQISFPGGGLEKIDKSYEECALRETYEEIGVPPANIDIIGSLTSLYVFASNNLVYPFVGYLKEPVEFVQDDTEVEKIISVPLNHFFMPETIKTRELTVRGHRLNNVPYYDINGQVLWGATAMMMAEFLSLWKEVR